MFRKMSILFCTEMNFALFDQQILALKKEPRMDEAAGDI